MINTAVRINERQFQKLLLSCSTMYNSAPNWYHSNVLNMYSLYWHSLLVPLLWALIVFIFKCYNRLITIHFDTLLHYGIFGILFQIVTLTTYFIGDISHFSKKDKDRCLQNQWKGVWKVYQSMWNFHQCIFIMTWNKIKGLF